MSTTEQFTPRTDERVSDWDELADDAQPYDPVHDGRHGLDINSSDQVTVADLYAKPDIVKLDPDQRYGHAADDEMAQVPLPDLSDAVSDLDEPGHQVKFEDLPPIPVDAEIVPEDETSTPESYGESVDRLIVSIDACRQNVLHEPDMRKRTAAARNALDNEIINETDLSVINNMSGTDPERLVHSLDQVELACGGRDSLAAGLLNRLPEEAVGDMYEFHDKYFNRVMRRACEDESWQGDEQKTNEVTRLVVDSMKRVHGEPIFWKMGEQVGDELPDYVHTIAKSPEFAAHAVTSHVNRLMSAAEKEGASEERQLKGFRASPDRILKHFLGVPEDMAEDFKKALSERTDIKKGQHVNPSHLKLGDLDVTRWHDCMRAYAENVARIGIEGAKQLNEVFGIVNFDRYDPATLERMHKLASGDEETIRQLKSGDISVVINDTFGDENGALNDDMAKLDDQKSTLMFEVQQPSDIYRSLINLHNRYDMKPSTLIISTHGEPGQLHFGTAAEGFILASELRGGHEYVDKERILSLADSQVGRFISKYMVPGRESGERAVVLAACSQASNSIYTKRPTSDTIALQSRRSDKVVVMASETLSALQRDEDGKLRFHNLGSGHVATETRRRRTVGLSHTVVKPFTDGYRHSPLGLARTTAQK